MMLFFTACASSLQVDHSIKYQKKGSRSERRDGVLLINDTQLPYIFEKVCVEGKTFILEAKPHSFGNHGYFPAEGDCSPSMSDKAISKEALSEGYYAGNERLKNTPETWFFVSWKSGNAFIDGERLDDVLKKEPFASLPNLVNASEFPVMKKK